LAAKLQAVKPASAKPDNTYLTLQSAYKAALASYSVNRANTVLLVTDGPDDDSAVTGDKLLQSISALADKAKPVRIDIITITGASTGPATRTKTLQSLAQQTSGTFASVTSSDDAELGAALGRALTPSR
jgi:hypothetical protein